MWLWLLYPSYRFEIWWFCSYSISIDCKRGKKILFSLFSVTLIAVISADVVDITTKRNRCDFRRIRLAGATSRLNVLFELVGRGALRTTYTYRRFRVRQKKNVIYYIYLLTRLIYGYAIENLYFQEKKKHKPYKSLDNGYKCRRERVFCRSPYLIRSKVLGYYPHS